MVLIFSVEQDTEQLRQASDYQSRARRKKVILAIIGLIILVVLIVVISTQVN